MEIRQDPLLLPASKPEQNCLIPAHALSGLRRPDSGNRDRRGRPDGYLSCYMQVHTYPPDPATRRQSRSVGWPTRKRPRDWALPHAATHARPHVGATPPPRPLAAGHARKRAFRSTARGAPIETSHPRRHSAHIRPPEDSLPHPLQGREAERIAGGPSGVRKEN